MKLKTLLFGKTYAFRDVKDVLAKANEPKSGDRLAGLAAESAQERVAAKAVLAELLLRDLRENPAVPYEQDEVTHAILTAAGTNRSCSAGRGVPRPYNAPSISIPYFIYF